MNHNPRLVVNLQHKLAISNPLDGEKGMFHVTWRKIGVTGLVLVPLPNKADEILSLTRAYTLAFFDQSLKQQPSPILEAPFESRDVLLEIIPSQ